MRAWTRVWWPVAGTFLALALGGVLGLAERPEAGLVWGAAVTATAAALAWEIVGELRHRRPGVDVIALLAMAGAVALGELLAGAIIAVMLTTGRALERQADARARRELTALLESTPQVAHRRVDDALVAVPAGEVAVGDVLIVRPGEAVPVDGIVLSDHGVLDESTLTGESQPVEVGRAERVPSGAVNIGGPLELRAAATAAASTYSALVRLVEQAQAERPPLARLADRAAGWFVPLTLLVAGTAWGLTGDPVRALAVLVVATPCPLILATPIAITSGMSRLAKRGIIVKNGGALETLAKAQAVLLDKTGTVTAGRPRVLDIVAFGHIAPEDVLAVAASLDQVSAHVFAAALVHEARDRGLALSFPMDVHETSGAGIAGRVDDRSVRLGRAEWVRTLDGDPMPPAAASVRRRAAVEGASVVFVGVDGELAGAIFLEDPLRAEAVRTVRGLRRDGVHRVVLLTGDRADVGALVGAAIDVDGVLAERRPEDKVAAVLASREERVTVMIGDGVNDAPALAHADVGVAMGSRGAAASSEAADVVILVDRFDRVREAIAVARRTRRIAWQSIGVGMGAAAVAMIFAAFGWLEPVAGALVQEGIDVAAILVALRALGGGPRPAHPPHFADQMAGLGERLRGEHAVLRSGVDRLTPLADRLDALDGRVASEQLRDLRRFLSEEVVPHEMGDEKNVYPLLAGAAPDEDPTGPLRHTHREIFRLIRLLDAVIAGLPDDGPGDEDLPELRRLLYGLHTVLRMHMEQEEEAYGVFDAVESASALR